MAQRCWRFCGEARIKREVSEASWEPGDAEGLDGGAWNSPEGRAGVEDDDGADRSGTGEDGSELRGVGGWRACAHKLRWALVKLKAVAARQE